MFLALVKLFSLTCFVSLAGLGILFEAFTVAGAAQTLGLTLSVWLLNKHLGFHKKEHTEYVVCPRCYSLHVLNNCSERVGGVDVSKRCSFVPYPNHPQHKRRRPCGALLMQTVRRGSQTKLEPFLTFCYKPLRERLSELLSRPGIEKQCEEWRTRNVPAGRYSDIFDGAIWQEFARDDQFLAEAGSLGLSLQFDYFNPFSGTEYSVGVLYLQLLNLPRPLRCKLQNCIIVGIVPGPREPHDIQHLLRPLVDELLALWQGCQLRTYQNPLGRTVRAALLLVCCDLPAVRKLAGFQSHSAYAACSRCDRLFRKSAGKPSCEYPRRFWSPIILFCRRRQMGAVLREHAQAWKLETRQNTPTGRKTLAIGAQPRSPC